MLFCYHNSDEPVAKKLGPRFSLFPRQRLFAALAGRALIADASGLVALSYRGCAGSKLDI
jgi:hypothetical protein